MALLASSALEVLPSLLRQLSLSQATRLARAGHLETAAAILTEEPSEVSSDPDWLSLLARIRAQQGAWLDAERLWQRALQQNPNHVGSQDALARLRSTRRLPARSVSIAVLGAIAVVFAGLLTANYLLFQQNRAELSQLQVSLAHQQEVQEAYTSAQFSGLSGELQSAATNIKTNVRQEQQAQAQRANSRFDALGQQMGRIRRQLDHASSAQKLLSQQIDGRLEKLNDELDHARRQLDSMAPTKANADGK